PQPNRRQIFCCTVFAYLDQYFARFRIACNSPQWNLQYLVFPVLTGAERLAAVRAVFGNHVFPEFQMKKSPELAIAFDDNMSSSSAIATIRAALRRVFVAVQMGRTRTTLS